MKHVSKLLLDVRDHYDLSQAELAKDVKFRTAQHISNIERGKSPFGIDLGQKLIKLGYCDPEEVYNALVIDYSDHIAKLLKIK